MVNIGVENRPALHYAALPLSVSFANLPLRVSEAFDALGGYFATRGIEPVGPALIRYRTKHVERPFNIEVGWAVAPDAWIEAPYVLSTIPGGKYVTARQEGDFRDLAKLEEDMVRWAAAQSVELDVTEERTGAVWGANIELHPEGQADPLSNPRGFVELCLLAR